MESFVEVLPVPPQQERRRGVVRFVGLTDFAEGEWVGVELVGSEGRNDGSVKGQSYFKCLPGQGVFVRPNLVIPYGSLKAEGEEKVKQPDPLLAKIANLEKQLAAAQQRAMESAAAEGKSKEELDRVQAELASLKAAAAAQQAANDDDDFAAQVRLEEERMSMQKQLAASQAEAQAAQDSARSALDAQAAAEARAKDALAAQQRSDAASAQLQAYVANLEKALAKAQADATAAAATTAAAAAAKGQAAEAVKAQHDAAASVPPPQQQQPSTDPGLPTELEALRTALTSSKVELQQLRNERDNLSNAKDALSKTAAAQQERLAAAENKARVAEQRVQEMQKKWRDDTAAASLAHATTLADLRAELAALKTETAKLETSKAAELLAVEERLAHEKEAALQERDTQQRQALAAAQHEKDELQELCQLLEDELKEEKSQSDELARLVEQLGSEKVLAEAAVGSVHEQTVQERDRLRREVEEARAREVRLMSAAEDAQRERDAALQQLATSAHDRTREKRHDASLSFEGDDADTPAALVAALEQCRSQRDEAQMRVLQLTSAQQVAQELQQRCDGLTLTMQRQQLEAQKRLEDTQAKAEAAQAKMTAEVTLWKRQCAAVQRNAAELAATVANVQYQQQLATTDAAGRPTAFLGSQLDAARERCYEDRIARLTQLLLEHQSARLSAVSVCLSPFLQNTQRTEANGLSFASARPSVRLLDFSSPEACRASTQSLFHAA